jgi:hypothetical protein
MTPARKRQHGQRLEAILGQLGVNLSRKTLAAMAASRAVEMNRDLEEELGTVLADG